MLSSWFPWSGCASRGRAVAEAWRKARPRTPRHPALLGAPGLAVAGAILALLLAGGARATATGVLEVRIHDHREAIEDFRSLVVTIPTVGIHPAGRPRTGGWLSLPTDNVQVDLTRHTAERPATILRGTLEPGAYDGIRLDFGEIRATRRDGGTIPVLAASGPVAARFTATSGMVTTVTLDLRVIDLSDHPPKGYELHITTVSITAGAP